MRRNKFDGSGGIVVTETYKNTSLWRNAFQPRNDSFDEHRAILAGKLSDFRSNVEALVSFIPQDMKHYTVHDITHLDALWQVADLIAGDEYHLTPAEAFVFGGAVLLHDAGMTLAAYPGGLTDIEHTQEWQDSFSLNLRRLGGGKSLDQLDHSTAHSIREQTVTETLRVLHASKAEQLATQAWVASNGEQIYLLPDPELRQHYGQTIGRIAHSHHWSARVAQRELSSPLGAFKSMPWSVNKVKIAMLLRCADAAHIDSRRAPLILKTFTQPTGISAKHWQFQSKLSNAQAITNRLLYTSTSAFSVDDAEAWQLCFDTIQMIDKELRDADDVLSTSQIPQFRVQRVVGADSPDILAQHVKVDGWSPVLTEIRVSDVPSLARSLGGTALYSSQSAPLRELLQNAADSIEARVAIEPGFDLESGRITVRVIEPPDNSGVILEVEDNGIGMSERTLTSSLLDFGQSFWNSQAARNEFPGLNTKFQHPRGRYGIGFFSIFMWSDVVSVFSRRFDAGKSDGRVLEFKRGLGARAIVRPMQDAEFSSAYNTRIRLSIPKDRVAQIFSGRQNGDDERLYIISREVRRQNWPDLVRLLCATLPIKVCVELNGTSKVVNLSNWLTADMDSFVRFYEDLAGNFSVPERKFTRAFSEVPGPNGAIGRAFLSPVLESNRYNHHVYIYERGIFAGLRRMGTAYGIIEGATTNAARDSVNAPFLLTNQRWLATQKDYLFRMAENHGEVLACQEAFLQANDFDENNILFVLDRNFCSLAEVKDRLKETGSVNFRLRRGSDKEYFTAKKTDTLSVVVGRNVNRDQLYFLVDILGEIHLDQDLLKLSKLPESPLKKVLESIVRVIDPKTSPQKSLVQADSYSSEKALFVQIQRDPSPDEGP